MKHCKDNEMMLDRVGRIQKVFDDMESLIENLHQLGPEDFPEQARITLNGFLNRLLCIDVAKG